MKAACNIQLIEKHKQKDPQEIFLGRIICYYFFRFGEIFSEND